MSLVYLKMSWQTQPVGTLADGSLCHLTRTGWLEFYAGNAPALGEMLVVGESFGVGAVGNEVPAPSA